MFLLHSVWYSSLWHWRVQLGEYEQIKNISASKMRKKKKKLRTPSLKQNLLVLIKKESVVLWFNNFCVVEGLQNHCCLSVCLSDHPSAQAFFSGSLVFFFDFWHDGKQLEYLNFFFHENSFLTKFEQKGPKFAPKHLFFGFFEKFIKNLFKIFFFEII